MLPPNLLNEISEFTLRISVPIYWHDRKQTFPKRIRGGTCFILRFESDLIAVTAAHVVREYEADRAITPNFVCQLKLLEFMLHEAIIDCDDHLDIATFRVTEQDLLDIGGTPVDCRGDSWPPPQLVKMRAVSFAGFPEEMIVTNFDKSGIFSAYGGLSTIEDFSDREILLIYDPKREQTLLGLPLPPVDLNLSGCSGGPLLFHVLKNGLHRWFPVGLIRIGPRRNESDKINLGELGSFAMIRAARIHNLKPNGTITKLGFDGWLPS